MNKSPRCNPPYPGPQAGWYRLVKGSGKKWPPKTSGILVYYAKTWRWVCASCPYESNDFYTKAGAAADYARHRRRHK